MSSQSSIWMFVRKVDRGDADLGRARFIVCLSFWHKCNNFCSGFPVGGSALTKMTARVNCYSETRINMSSVAKEMPFHYASNQFAQTYAIRTQNVIRHYYNHHMLNGARKGFFAYYSPINSTAHVVWNKHGNGG